MAFSASEVIARPVDEVWNAATDWARAPEWMKGLEALRPLDDGPVGKGSRLAFQSRRSEREARIVEWEPGRRLILQSRQGGITADYAYSFGECAGGTIVTLNAGCRGEGLFWRLASPLIAFKMARADGGQVKALKRMVEQSAESSSARAE